MPIAKTSHNKPAWGLGTLPFQEDSGPPEECITGEAPDSLCRELGPRNYGLVFNPAFPYNKVSGPSG